MEIVVNQEDRVYKKKRVEKERGRNFSGACCPPWR
jgi:hypothetical protein